MMDQIPEGAIPIDQFQPAEGEAAPQAAATPPPGAVPIEQFQTAEEKYGTLGQQGLTAIESAGRHLTFGLTDALAAPMRSLGEKLGINPDIMAPKPEEMAARQEENPWTAGVSGAAALTAGVLTGAGAPGLIAGFGEGLVPIAAEATAMSKIGSHALRGAIETGIFQGGDEISKAMLGTGDPETPVASALAHMGAAALLGGGLGGVFGGISAASSALGTTKYAKMAGEALEDLGKRMSILKEAPTAEEIAIENMTSRALPKLQRDAGDLMAAADRLDLPVMNGMVSGDQAVRKAEDLLIHGPPTRAAAKRQNLYKNALDSAYTKLEDVMPKFEVTKEQAGHSLQESLFSKIAEEHEPFNALYGAIKEVTPTIPLQTGTAPTLARNIRSIEGVKEAFKSPAAKLARDIAAELEAGRITNVDQLRAYQSELGARLAPTASASEKRVLSIIKDKLDDWERRTIRNYSGEFVSSIEKRTDLSPMEKTQIWGDKLNRLKSLQSEIDAADSKYAPFRQKISELSSWLGKEKVGGAKDAMSFIKDRLEPEDVINRLASKKYAGLGKFMQQNFPEEFKIIQEYQKSLMKKGASKTGEFSPKVFFNRFNEMEPEIQNSIFSPEEVQRIKDINTYTKKITDLNFNPSGTSHAIAHRSLYESLKNLLVGNVRDEALSKYVIGEDMAPALKKLFAEDLSDAQKAAVLKAMSENAPENIPGLLDYTKRAERGAQMINRSIDIVFKSGAQQALDYGVSEKSREKLRKYIEDGVQNQEIQQAPKQKYAEGGEVTPAPAMGMQQNPLESHVPAQNMLIQSAKGRINNYLNSQRPLPRMGFAFDKKEVSKQKEREYNKLLDLANQPLGIMSKIRAGTVTSTDVRHFNNLFPELHSHLSKKLTERVSQEQIKGNKPPFQTRQALSLFLGSPLDSAVSGKTILAAQSVYAQKRGAQPAAPAQNSKPSGSKSALSKTGSRYSTGDQAVISRQQKDH